MVQFCNISLQSYCFFLNSPNFCRNITFFDARKPLGYHQSRDGWMMRKPTPAPSLKGREIRGYWVEGEYRLMRVNGRRYKKSREVSRLCYCLSTATLWRSTIYRAFAQSPARRSTQNCSKDTFIVNFSIFHTLNLLKPTKLATFQQFLYLKFAQIKKKHYFCGHNYQSLMNL